MYCEIPEFSRCCGCMPLRHGVLVLSYINIIYSSLMIILFSVSIHYGYGVSMIYHGAIADLDDSVSLVAFTIDLYFKLLLVYGCHKRNIKVLKIGLYYTLINLGVILFFEVFGLSYSSDVLYYMDYIPLFLVIFGLNVYLYLLVRSLVRKLEMAGRNFENPLHQFINGELKVENNVIYPSTVLPNESV